jgi:hypothetical protein
LLRLQVVAQFNTFLLAAFETTAAAIAFSIYFIAQHPQVEARLLQELFTQRQVHELNGQQDVPQVGLWRHGVDVEAERRAPHASSMLQLEGCRLRCLLVKPC